MNLQINENLLNQNVTPSNDNLLGTNALRQAAEQFEAVLLTQLTSSLSGTNNDEDSLFGGDAGSGLAKQMFSEQVANTMSQAGGIGLGQMILKQFGVDLPNSSVIKEKISDVVSTIKETVSETVSDAKTSPPLFNRKGKVSPVTEGRKGNLTEAEVVTTVEEDIKKYGNEGLEKFTVDGKVLNTTRPRLVNPATSEINRKNAIKIDKMDFQMPVNGRISSNFGNRFHPIDKVMKFHSGIDIAAPKGTPIGSSAEGIVTFSGWRRGYGNLVIVQHPDGRETRYAHADKLFVNEGERVFAGQIIAAVGSTGKSTGPHLHFEVRENGQPVNPRNFLFNVLQKNADK